MLLDRATETDLPAVRALLEQQRLPLDGIEAALSTMVVARENEAIVGVAALELYDGSALLRSVAVSPSSTGRGIGQALTRAALRLARDAHVADVILLTTTAEGFFPRFGFVPIRREDVPAAVRSSVEFVSACPSSAVVMRTRLH